MPNIDIKQNLINKFTQPLSDFYQRRIVFWKDSEKEFESFVDELNIDNVKIAKLNNSNSFYVKKLLLMDEPETNFLIYDTSSYNDPRDCWMWDVELYSESFRADYLSTLMEEMDIAQEKYHEEMDYLFSQLTDENLADSSVINELTDYRTYLDYDIQVISKEGKIQKFSKTYGEKSGGETQTPYYVAIAASFAQMYAGRETARIVMLDEAFNNMDEDRIESMMQFLKSQEFQLILAAPPARMEVIGEHVDSIYLTIHKGLSSTVEEYFL